MSKNSWIIIIIIAAVIGIAGVWYFFYRDISDNTVTTAVTTNSSQQTTDTTEKTVVKSIQLKAIDPYTGSGKATRVFDGKTFIHTVTATVSDPAPGKFLEGWLVKNPTTKEFFSTGKLTKEGGVYKLTYTSTRNYPDHKNVVITEETQANGLDGVPEAHVLEGSFND